MSLFKTGPVMMTPGIKELMCAGNQAIEVIQRCLDRHTEADWGDLCDEDKQLNDDALEAERSGRPTDSLFSSYDTDLGQIYIITECDRSVTTILLPNEY